jgi:riboflavin biosynthesis pyrimidine reductase
VKITTLYEREKSKASLLTPELERLYDGVLWFPQKEGRPYVISNFVASLDGVVSYGIPGKSDGGTISGLSAEDHYVMGLLRALADAVIIGSGTLPQSPRHVGIPEFIYPEAQDEYAALRRKLGKPPRPLNVILTASGNIDLSGPTFHTEDLRAVIITTDEGASRLSSEDLSTITVRSTGERRFTSPHAVLKILAQEFNVRLLLHEGGPTIFGQYLAAGCVDESFLTVAPQVAGRKMGLHRPSFAGETSFLPETAPRQKLESVKRGGADLLLLRYATFQK